MKNTDIENENISFTSKDISSSTEKISGFHERLAFLISRHKNRHSFAKACNISQSGLMRLMAGGFPTLPILIAIATANNVSVEWLATGNKGKEADPIATLEQDQFYVIPTYIVQSPQLALDKTWVDHSLKLPPEHLIVMEATGDSMLGEINDKDMLLINTHDTSLRDGIYVLQINDDITIKRIQRLVSGIIRVVSANSAYQPFEIDVNTLPKDFSVMGRVVWFGRIVP